LSQESASSSNVARYKKLNGKFLKDAEKLLDKGDLVQASEKFWGAAAEIVKAYASSKQIKTRTHNDLWQVVIDLNKEHPRLGLLKDFNQAGYLHSNFYEDELRPEAVRVAGEAVREFVTKVERLIVVE
jgi:uncharacterized protein (UPF0332 family)